jgi:hypothetical protein
MALFPAPARTEISDTYPAPSNAVARTGFGKLWDFATSLLGITGAKQDLLVASKILDPQALYNISLVPGVNANALTMTVKTGDGATSFSTSNAGTVAQRSATAATGAYNVRNITADISTVISSGSTAGHVSAVAAYLYWYLLDNAGTQELAWSSKDFGSFGIVSTTAEGGAGAADSATVMYSTVARSNVPFRFIGRSTDTQTTAGLWAAVPTLIELFPITEGLKTKKNSVSLLENVGFLVSVAGNAITVALKDELGNDPAPGSPVRIGFRSATLTTGTPDVLEVTAASSIVASSGSTLGTVSAQAHRIYIIGVNDAGTFRLGLWNPWDNTNKILNGINENNVYSSTAEGGAGAADSAQVLYTGTAVSAKAVRILGYFESTQATAGTWVTGHSKAQVMGPGVWCSGDVVQIVSVKDSATATGTTTTPLDNTIPQSGEGTQFMSATITPSSAINVLEIEHIGQYETSIAVNAISALFQDAVANALHAMSIIHNPSNATFIHAWKYPMLAAIASATTFKVRVGAAAAATIRFNGFSGAGLFNGVCNSYLNVKEIFI